MERIADREHAAVYDNMIAKREEEIAGLQNKIEESRQFDEVSRQKRDNLKSTAYLLEEILSESKISDANLRILIKQIYVHQNEDKSLDVRSMEILKIVRRFTLKKKPYNSIKSRQKETVGLILSIII
ncbi:MAG: hypothetical protein K2O36_05755 [Ruminococcus sp.]|nr:hypothetical protein [Ruminococcus sp.]